MIINGKIQSRTKQTFWAVKKLEILQVEDGYAAEGVPHPVVSMVDPGFCRFAGKLARWRTRLEERFISPTISLTFQNQILTFRGINGQ